MEVDEIKRRVRALLSMAPEDRPFPVYRLAAVSETDPGNLRRYSLERDGLYRNSKRRLERALTLLENDQVVVRHGKKHLGETYTYSLRDPQPKQSMLTRVRMTERGPVLDFVAVNKSAFPVLPPVNK